MLYAIYADKRHGFTLIEIPPLYIALLTSTVTSFGASNSVNSPGEKN